MIRVGQRVKTRLGGNEGKVRAVRETGFGRQLTIALDRPDRFGAKIAYAWDRDGEEALEPGQVAGLGITKWRRNEPLA